MKESFQLIFFVAVLFIMAVFSGCGLLGIRDMDAWGFKVNFAEGLDVHAGANSIDHVEDKRGVNPVRSYDAPAVQRYEREAKR